MNSNDTNTSAESSTQPGRGVPPPPGLGALTPPDAPQLEHGRKRASAVAASVIAGVLVLSGAGAALALTNTWPFQGSSGADTAAAQTSNAGLEQVAPPTFADGIELKWSLEGADLHPDGQLTGHLPRMLGNINEASRSYQPIQIDSGVLLNYTTEESRGVTPPRWALLDAEQGDVLWDDAAAGDPLSCAVSPDGAEAACSSLLGGDAQLSTVGEQGIGFAAHAEFGSVRYSTDGIEVLREEAIDKFSAEGQYVGSEAVGGIFAGSVGNARVPDCVWLSGAGQISYIGTGCDAPREEVLVEVDAFTWSVLGEENELLLISSDGGTRVFDLATREQLWAFPGGMPGNLQYPNLVQQGEEQGVLLRRNGDEGSGYAVVGLRSGTEAPLDITGGTVVVAANEVLVFNTEEGLGADARSVSSVEVFDGVTGEWQGAFEFPEITDISEITGGPLGVLIGHPKCVDCTTAEGSHIIDRYSFLGPAESAAGATLQRASDVQISTAIPAACPADTVLLAWAELSDGWVLVCGITLTEPSYLVYQPADGTPRSYSQGATQPASPEARGALHFDERLGRYIAQMSDGSVLTLDYDIGTLTVRDSAGEKTADQQRLVRYIFVLLGSDVRTVEDVSKEAGAFSVQAPGETAEDQVRYMIEVLEKAYAGRALVKDALPKLEHCTAPAGGYGDSIATMQAVRENRAELLEALDAMPIDRIPQGQRLLDELVDAIRHSHAANVEYVAWAESANVAGCASLSQAGRASAKASDGPKEAFAELWNSAVAPKYGVRTFDAGHI
ncbi:hypothetical protein ACI1US_02351 [Leucobacter sp. BZR 635]